MCRYCERVITTNGLDRYHRNCLMMGYKDTYIENVSDYLIWVKTTNNTDVIGDEGIPFSFENGYGYYRGQSCVCWELKPSVLRVEPYLNEHSLLNKANLRLSNEISSLKTPLEKMIFFQHYGLCTRLLDVTFNPLVALFMACCEEDKQSCDGVVYCGHNTESQNTNIAELTAKYVFEHEVQRMIVGFQKFAIKEKVDINCFVQPTFILPPINNPRIEAQNGAFIMAPLISEVIDDNSALQYRKNLGDSDFFDARRAVIKGCKKENILHELSVLGIDSGTIYKGIEGKLKAILTEEKMISNRLNNLQR